MSSRSSRSKRIIDEPVLAQVVVKKAKVSVQPVQPKGGKKEVLDEYAFVVYHNLATARLPKGDEAAKVDTKNRFRFLLKDWVSPDSAADELRQAKNAQDFHDFNALEVMVNTTKSQCLRLTEHGRPRQFRTKPCKIRRI